MNPLTESVLEIPRKGGSAICSSADGWRTEPAVTVTVSKPKDAVVLRNQSGFESLSHQS